jgi:predicted peroxiredoxin
MRFLIALLLITSTFISCNDSPSTSKSSGGSNEILINLTSDPTVSAHGSLMGIHLAENALTNGLKATVFLNVNGVKLLQPEADTLAFQEENIIKALNKVTEKGGEIIACPHCMEALGIDQDKIQSNVQVGKEKVMMDKLKNNPTVFTY